MKRRRDAVVLTVSFVAHIALLAAWMSTRPDLPPAESPPIEVQILRLPPKTPQPATKPTPPRPHTETRPLVLHQPPPSAPPPPPNVASEISPAWRVKPDTSQDLENAPFANGRPKARAQAPRPSCKSLSWDRPVDCPPDQAELAASKADPARDSATAGFEAAGRYKRAEKAYHEAPGGAGYPGIACAIFHKC